MAREDFCPAGNEANSRGKGAVDHECGPFTPHLDFRRRNSYCQSNSHSRRNVGFRHRPELVHNWCFPARKRAVSGHLGSRRTTIKTMFPVAPYATIVSDAVAGERFAPKPISNCPSVPRPHGGTRLGFCCGICHAIENSQIGISQSNEMTDHNRLMCFGLWRICRRNRTGNAARATAGFTGHVQYAWETNAKRQFLAVAGVEVLATANGGWIGSGGREVR